MTRSLVAKNLGLTVLVLIPWPLGAAPVGPSRSPGNEMGVVRRTDLIQQVTVAGNIVPNRRTVIAPPYNAYIKKLFVGVGDRVKAGDPVVSLVQSIRSRHEEIHPLRAPFDGTVVQVSRAEGEFVEQNKEGNTIARIDDLNRLFLFCEVPENEISKIKTGQEVVIKANAILSRTYKGVIRDVALAAKEKKDGWGRAGDRVEFEIRIEITDKDDQLRPGMSAIVDIITDKRHQTLALPHEYILKSANQYTVTLESGEKRKVKVGLKNQEMFEILSGLKENERVRVVDFFSLPEED